MEKRLSAARSALTACGQEHVLRFWELLDESARAVLLDEIEALDLAHLAHSIRAVLTPADQGGSSELEPAPMLELPEGKRAGERDAAARQAGEALLQAGKAGAFLVAGGQGTRLGYDGPKGRFPVGPLTNRSLFAYHCHRVLATSRRYDAEVPFYIMTSRANHASTVAAFEEAGNFGLEPGQVHLFEQGLLPAVDSAGRMLLSEPGRLALSPDGHGGCFGALDRAGALDDMQRRGVEHLFYFQVDNPLAPVCDPVFLGHHVLADSEMSTKVVSKTEPGEKVGVLGHIDGNLGVIEYSDLDPALAAARDPQGRLRFRAGNIAIHAITLAFIRRLVGGDLDLPVHRASKKVAFVDEAGGTVTPTEPNAIKMELFVFDALPLAERTLVQEVRREDEFAPVKNAEGADSPATSRALLIKQGQRWMAAAGLALPDGPVEVGPLFALDQDEFLRVLTRADFGPVFDRC